MITAHSPKYTSENTIGLMAKFPWLSEEVPFCASNKDSEAHGRELYARAIAGEFGAIAPYVAPPVVETPVVTVDPVEKLRAFLTANPDVAAIL